MNQHNEQISALMDDELNSTEQKQAIDLLLESKTAQRAWVEYHLIRDCLQHSADIAPKPSSKIRQWLNKIPANDHRYSAAIAASLAVVAFLGIMLWGRSSPTPEPVVVETQPAMVIENPALTQLSINDDSVVATVDSNEYYLHTHRQSVDMDGLKQVSYSFE